MKRVEQTVGRRAIVNNTLAARFSIQFQEGQSTFTSDTGDEEDFRSLVLDFRSFMAAKEDVFANRIFNIIEEMTSDPENVEAIRHNRERWRVARKGQMAIIVNGKTLSAEECFDLYVNGDLFHQDESKAKFLATLPELMQQLIRQQMVSFVMDGLGPLWATRNVAIAVLDE